MRKVAFWCVKTEHLSPCHTCMLPTGMPSNTSMPRTHQIASHRHLLPILVSLSLSSPQMHRQACPEGCGTPDISGCHSMGWVAGTEPVQEHLHGTREFLALAVPLEVPGYHHHGNFPVRYWGIKLRDKSRLDEIILSKKILCIQHINVYFYILDKTAILHLLKKFIILPDELRKFLISLSPFAASNCKRNASGTILQSPCSKLFSNSVGFYALNNQIFYKRFFILCHKKGCLIDSCYYQH